MRRIQSIPTLTFLCAVAVLVIMTAAMLIIWMPYHFESYRRQTEDLESALLVRQKQLLKDQVDRAVNYIDYMRSKTETRLRDHIKARVYEACAIARNIYREHKDDMPRQEIEKLVKDALRPIRFNQGRGYYFATRLDSTEALFADRPEMEGRDMSGVRDLQGRFVVPDMVAIVKASGEGFYRYLWTKPGCKDKGFPKIAFVKLFEPFGWLIGTGEYLEDVEAAIKAEVGQRLEAIRFARDGYVFAHRYDGVPVTRPGKGRDMFGITDANGVKIVQEFIAAAKKGGGFVQYVMPPLEGILSKPKISFVRGVPEWQWYVGAGTYIEDIQELAEAGRARLKRELWDKLLKLLVIFLGTGLLALGIFWLISARIRKELETFSRFFKQASGSFKPLDERRLYFPEYRSLAGSANTMLAAREKAMHDLQRSEERFKELAESLPESIFEIDLQGKLTFVNRRATDHFGYSQQDFARGLNAIDMLIPADRRRAAENIANGSTAGKTGFNEYTALRKDGSTFPCLVYSTPIRNDGKPVGLRGFIIDNTQRKKAEDALKSRERYYRSLISNLHEDILVIDRNCRITDVNNTFLVTTGHRREEVVGRHCFEINHGRRRSCREYGEGCGLVEILKSGRARSCTHEHLKKDGSRVVADILYSPLKDGKGNVTHIIQAVRDVTEMARVKDELRQSEEKFRMISTSAQDAIVIMDSAGKISYWNPAAERIFGYSVQEAAGVELQSLIVPRRLRESFAGDISRFKENSGGKIAGRLMELEAVNRDQDEFPVELSVSAGNLGNRRHTIGIIRDITEKKQLEQQLRQTQKMEAIGTLAGGIAHDFNNILSAIIGYSELVLDKLPLNNPLRSDVEEVFNAGIRARDLVKQILTFSRQSEQKLQPVQLKLIVKEALKLLKASLPATIAIRDNIQSENLVLADPTQMHQILMNLCTNAGHAMRQRGGTLEVSLIDVHLDAESAAGLPGIAAGPYMKLSVIDTGPGVPAEILEKIFDPFFSTKEKDEGTGLGLSVVQGIVNSHSGAITVSSAPDKGATFNVYLPVSEASDEPELKVSGSLPAGNEHILFVDDEKILVDLGQEMLKQQGYAVTTRTSSIEALELFKAKPEQFDLVVTDMTMPNMTGEKLAEELITIKPGIPIILCTGFSLRSNKKRFDALGIKGLLMKPVARADLALMVRKVLDETGFPPGADHVVATT